MGTDARTPAQARLEFEHAAVGALLRYWRLHGDEPITPTHVYGWVVKPAPAGWTVRQARLACERLEARDFVIATVGDRFHPRGYRLAEDFRSACPADGCPGLEWHRGSAVDETDFSPRPCGCGHPTKTSNCEGLTTVAYLEWKDPTRRVG